MSLVFKCLQYSSLPPFNVSLLISNTFPFLSLSSMSAASAFSLSLLRALMTSVHVPGGYTPVHLVHSPIFLLSTLVLSSSILSMSFCFIPGKNRPKVCHFVNGSSHSAHRSSDFSRTGIKRRSGWRPFCVVKCVGGGDFPFSLINKVLTKTKYYTIYCYVNCTQYTIINVTSYYYNYSIKKSCKYIDISLICCFSKLCIVIHQLFSSMLCFLNMYRIY